MLFPEKSEVYITMKKGQAAMEFLMTYGWAILVVLAAIGALAYFGVLSPGNLLPEKTTFKAPFLNTEAALITEVATGVQVEVPFTNSQGGAVNIDLSSGTSDGADGDCVIATPDLDFSGATTNPIPNGAKFNLVWNCTSATAVAGDKFKSELGFTYNTTASGLNRKFSGEVVGKVQ